MAQASRLCPTRPPRPCASIPLKARHHPASCRPSILVTPRTQATTPGIGQGSYSSPSHRRPCEISPSPNRVRFGTRTSGQSPCDVAIRVRSQRECRQPGRLTTHLLRSMRNTGEADTTGGVRNTQQGLSHALDHRQPLRCRCRTTAGPAFHWAEPTVQHENGRQSLGMKPPLS